MTGHCGPGASGRHGTSAPRPLKAGDAPEIIELHWRFFPAASGRRFLERAYYPTLLDTGSTGFGFVEVRSGKVVGFLAGALDSRALHKALVRRNFADCLVAVARVTFAGWSDSARALRTLRYFLSGSASREGAWIFFVAVDESCRNQGTAERLIAASVNYCRSQGLARCWIRTPKTNVAMQRVLKKTGFQVYADRCGIAENRFIYFLDLGQGAAR